MARRAVPRAVLVLGAVVGALVVTAVVLALVLGGGGRLLVPVPHTEAFDAAGIDLPALTTDGNEVRTVDGDPVVLRGVMPPDPAALARDGRFERSLVEDMSAAGANVVRIAVHPQSWQADRDYLWRYLDPMVRWCGEAGMYVILDWHSIGNVVTGRAPHSPELYSHTEESTREFWSAVAAHFADTPHVLFEVFNEPQGIAADDWRAAAEGLIGLIRDAGAQQPVIVGGVEYARDLSWVLDTPIDDPTVVYASHIYPAHSSDEWDTWFGDVAARIRSSSPSGGTWRRAVTRGTATSSGPTKGMAGRSWTGSTSWAPDGWRAGGMTTGGRRCSGRGCGSRRGMGPSCWGSCEPTPHAFSGAAPRT